MPDETGTASAQSLEQVSAGVSGLSVLGWLLLIGGLIGLGYGMTIDTTVETGGEHLGFGVTIPRQRIHNVGLMNEKQNTLIVSGVIALVGVVLVFAGRSGRA